MAGDNKFKVDPKKGFPATFLLFLFGALLLVFTFQNLVSTKQAKVAFSHQVEHLVNLNLLVPEESKKISQNENLVTFSGKFRDQTSEEGKKRFKYLELMASNHNLNNDLSEAEKNLQLHAQNVRESASYFLQISGLPLPAGGYRVGEGDDLLVKMVPESRLVSLKDLKKKLADAKSGGPEELQLIEEKLLVLIDEFRSPQLGIGAESMKQELKGLYTEVQEAKGPPLAKIGQYEKALAQLETLVVKLNNQNSPVRLSELRSVRQYKEDSTHYHQLISELEQNETQLDKLRPQMQNVVWFFNGKELSTKSLEKESGEVFSHWYTSAKEEWKNFELNKGLHFKAPDQPRNLVLEKTFKSEHPAPNYFSYILTILPVLLVVFLLYFVFSKQMKGVGGSAMNFGKSPARMLQKGQNKITFKDVAGIDEAKEELMEIVEFLKSPNKFTALGGRIPKGILCVGPPGTGKTLIARAVAGEADRPFFSIAGSDFVEMFVGVGASRIRDLFDQAKKSAPCIIFIDEIDAVGRHRGAGFGGGHDEREQTLNQLLVEMDGFDTNEGVIVIAATNRPDVLDKALLRPGRFDRRVMISLPDVKGRYEILKVHARKIKIDPSVDLMAIARSTPGSSGADLENLLNEAALLAARKGRSAVTAQEASEARDKVLYGKERRSLEFDEKEKKTTAIHEAGHAVVGLCVENGDPVDKVTIIPRGFSLGATHFLPLKNRLSYWRKELLDQLAVLMGGRVAEEIFVGDISSGAQQDIVQATRLARSMVCEWGMSDLLGAVAYGERGDPSSYNQYPTGERPYSDETAKAIDEEVRKLLDEAHARATEIINMKKKTVEEMVALLILYETLDAQDVKDIFHNEWNTEKKEKRLRESDNLFKVVPPPPPKTTGEKDSSLGVVGT